MLNEDLSPASITAGLDTRLIGRKVLYYPRLTSTMDIARREARRGAPEGTIVLADEQTAGKGRIKRLWFTPGGNIALSLVLYPALSDLPYLVMLASLAVVRSIETSTGLHAQIKWPNDVLIKGKKVCGILAESDTSGGAVAYAIIGIGINVDLRLADFPDIAATATSLVAELGREVSRLELLRCLLAAVERLYLSSRESIYQAWRDRLITLGKSVQVASGKSVIAGVAESVERDGSLLLRRSDGSVSRIVAGDVTLRDG